VADPPVTLVLPAGWSDGSGPLHLRLAAAVDELVRQGELADGAVLPTERELAARLSVSRSTVAHAYRDLKARGRVASRQGRGTWVVAPGGSSVRGPQAEHIAALLAHPDDTIDLALAVPPVLGGVRFEVSASGSGYEPAGLPQLREAIATHFGAQGLATVPEQVLVTSGAQQAISLAIGHLVSPGDVVVVEDATYVGALDAARAVGARIVAVGTDDSGVDVEALEAAVDRHRPALVYLNPVHQTPTGTVLSAERRRRVVALAQRTGVPVVDDLTLAGLGWSGGAVDVPLAALDRRAPILTVGSLSKVVWAGLRVGWVRANRSVIEALTARRMVDDLGGSLPAQVAAVELLGAYAQHCSTQADRLRAGHDRLVAALHSTLPEWDVPAVRGGTVLWVRLPDGADAEAFAALAAGHRVSVVPGPAVTAHGTASDRLRLAFVVEPDLLDEGVRRLVAAWADYRSTPRTSRRRPLLV
jgi:DNA-binding transcriptional MocR family regulator